VSKPDDFPRVPTPDEAEREAFLAEQERYERPDDYNVWEENQIFLDNEGDY
jgi:hypothetical protein